MALSSSYTPRPILKEIAENLSDPVQPASFPKTDLRFKNDFWAQRMGFGELTSQEWVDYFALFKPLPGNLEKTLALRYHGHQFTHYNPDLGDGRGFLYAQAQDPISKKILDFGTKGSGQTPYSRQGDGRLTLKGAVREALATTYLEYKGVNTSKTFCFFETGESLVRYDEPSPTRSAVLTRLSHSHIRFGTFQRLNYFKDEKTMKDLISYCLTHYYPDTVFEDFFKKICQAVAFTTAEWMIHGFVHGVLNTDNINITGESFDYGPYRFLPHYDPRFTAAYFDREGLYAYGRQPQMIFWNLQQLELALKLVVDDKNFFDKGYKAFQQSFEMRTYELFSEKLKIKPHDPDKIKEAFYKCIEFLEKTKYPFEEFFHKTSYWIQNPQQKLSEVLNNSEAQEVEELLMVFSTSSEKPIFLEETPQTLLIDEVEAIWKPIAEKDDWSSFNDKIDSLSKTN